MTPPLYPATRSFRLHDIDAARGCAVIAMIVVHCFAFYASHDTQEHSSGFVILDLGKLTAVFLVCMGVASAFSRRQDPRDLALRGGKLLALGYGLNVLKFLVPWFVFRNLPDGLIRDLGWEVGTARTFWNFLLLGDILHLAGISLLVIAGLRRLGARPWHLFALGAVFAVGGPLVWGLRGGGPLLTYVCDLLFSERFTVFFPLFPWQSYLLVGYGLGDVMRAWQGDPSALIRRWAVLGLGLMAFGIAIGVAYPPAWKGWDFYRTGPAGVTAVIGASLTLLHVSGWIWERAPRRVCAAVGYMSIHVTRVYVISWVTICWLMGWVGFMRTEDGLVLLELTAVVFAITIAVNEALVRSLGWIRAVRASGRVAATPALPSA